MLVVLPVCPRDVELATKNVRWMRKLDERCSYEALISCERGTDTKVLEEEAKAYFRTVHHFTYDQFPTEPTWPEAPNWCWSNTARYIANHFKTPWLFLEPDATPLKKGWLDALSKEYYEAGKPFMGHIVKGMGHMNGVAIYPSNVALHSTDALLCRKTAWDVMLAKDIRLKTHPANHLMAHFPRYTGVQLSFNEQAPVQRLLDKGYVLFHGCNDGSLIDILEGQQPSKSIFRKVVRFFGIGDVGADIDESESMWQYEAGHLQEKGYGVLAYKDCSKSMPSILKQTKFPAGIFPLPLNHRECHFNPGLLHFGGKYQLVTRRWLKDQRDIWHSSLVSWTLDDEMFPLNPVPIRFPNYRGGEQYEDPRVVVHRSQFCVAHCIWRHDRLYRAHQSLSIFDTNWNWIRTINAPYGGNGYHVGQGSAHEKNWVWFMQDDRWHFVYSFQPHVVVALVDGLNMIEYRSSLKPPVPWLYGEIRGGTPPVRVGDEYWSFFHSSLAWSGKKKRYYLGCYSFNSSPPFSVRRMTLNPILTGSDQDSRIHGGPLVVFPCGALYENGEWLVSFGINDELCGWIKIPHQKLSDLVTPV